MSKHVFAAPRYEGHPWLLLEDVKDPLLKTPMGIDKLKLSTNGDEFMYGVAVSSFQSPSLRVPVTFRVQRALLRLSMLLKQLYFILKVAIADSKYDSGNRG